MELIPLGKPMTLPEDELNITGNNCPSVIEEPDDFEIFPDRRRCFCLPRRKFPTTERLIALPARRNVLGTKCRHAGIDESGFRSRYLSDVKNVVRNQRYSMWTLIPCIMYEQFRLFFNFFFLILSLSQLIPMFEVGPWYTYFGPLIFVLVITLVKESFDDFKRYQRDKEVNGEEFWRIKVGGPNHGTLEQVKSQGIRVGDLIQIGSNQRVPADMLFLRTSDPSNQTYVRTDQLDGETDWKLRKPALPTHTLTLEQLASADGTVRVEPPKKDIYDFTGRLSLKPSTDGSGDRRHSCVSNGTAVSASAVIMEGLSLENTLWANCVVTKGNVIGLVMFTGREARATLNTAKAETKFGLLDEEVDWNAKMCFSVLILCCFGLTIGNGVHGTIYDVITWYRFVVLLSYIIPISLRVNLDMAKLLYSMRIQHDSAIPGTIMRNTSIPEELGRVDYLLSDKTGTLTQNEMIFKKIRVPTGEFTDDDIIRLRGYTKNVMKTSSAHHASAPSTESHTASAEKKKHLHNTQLRTEECVFNAALALGLCHNVTPIIAADGTWDLQAASPDEVALVKFAAEAGLKLVERDDHSITVEVPLTTEASVRLGFDVLACFPFTSTSKRMGILVRDRRNDELTFYLKGADVVMIERISKKGSSWLQEELENYARTGLRTLVVARKRITEQEYTDWKKKYDQAKTAMRDRDAKIQRVVDILETKMELIALTGVEDKLQEDVQQTLESLRHGGVKIWMLTGDKVETAICIAISTALKARHQLLFVMDSNSGVDSPERALQKLGELAAGRLSDSVLVLDGNVLGWLLLEDNIRQFIDIACNAPAVVCCRCSPTQKADVVAAIKKFTGKRTAAIGDGGNDVSMILAANIGIGIVGKEGKQASLSADVSVLQFSSIKRLLLWHGRNGYQASARLASFVIHRGLIISIIQVIFSSMFYFVAVPIFQGMLMVGYSTIFTMFPVFALCLDYELPERTVFMFPELYQSLRLEKLLSNKIFLEWLWKSIYQAAAIMLLSIVLFKGTWLNIVAITFTSLILSELLNVASEVHNWHPLMIIAELLSVYVYVYAVLILRSYFDLGFVVSFGFVGKLAIILGVSWVPVHFMKLLRLCLRPPQHQKLLEDQESPAHGIDGGLR
eukprot:GEMP01003776.1.p1 GENE.GEMP01003776.1~~GEMP01003776.1.p1  ORF type:complete len:1131 (+),score=237.03 GEMP01003776.1:51-3443(+)